MLADQPHGRRLTDAEQRQLDELARQVGMQDPRLAAALRHGVAVPDEPQRALVTGVAMSAAILMMLAALIGGAVGAATMVVVQAVALGAWLLNRRRHTRR